MRLGLIARADDGGLGHQTWEFARHMHPDAVLVIDAGEKGRSDMHLDRFEDCARQLEVWRPPEPDAPLSLDDRTINWLLARSDVFYTAETGYSNAIWWKADQAGAVGVLHANPELFSIEESGAQVKWLPTPYLRDRMPRDAIVVPFPVALDRFTYRPRTEARRFFHLWSSAMNDRNGTMILLSALEYVQSECTVVIAGPDDLSIPSRINEVTIEHRTEVPADYWRVIPDDCDVFLLPRRFAGLSLIAQEAAAQGIPTVTMRIDPWDQLNDPGAMVEPIKHREVRMRGGKIPVWTCDAAELGAKIDQLVRTPELVGFLSEAAYRRAASISWDVMAPVYRELMGCHQEQQG